jgi:hypothetical protein
MRYRFAIAVATAVIGMRLVGPVSAMRDAGQRLGD